MTQRLEERDGYTISTVDRDGANPRVYKTIPGFAPTLEYETALMIEEKGRTAYYILDGDWHEKYLACQSLDECKALFLANQEHKSKWSEDME